MGFQINEKGILPSPAQIKAVSEWTRPSNVQEVRQFIGLAQHYRRFIPSFASIASPITDLTKGTGSKRRPVAWTPDCEKAFVQIKHLLTSSPVLLIPDINKPFRIETDSSDFGVGAVLLQPSDDPNSTTWHPVAYESKKLSSAERNYPAQERELLGIIHALRTWECFIDGCPQGYKVYTDHFSLQRFRSQARPTPRLVRWLAELESYSPEIIYKSGQSNVVPDLLSRVDGADCVPATESFEPKYLYSTNSPVGNYEYLYTANVIASKQSSDKELSLVLQQDWPLLYKHDYDQRAHTTKLKTLLEREKANFEINKHDQRVYRKVKLKVDNGQNEDATKNSTTITKMVPFVPFVERADLVEKFHLGYGHAGVKFMNHLLEARHWWPTMRRDVIFWIKTCSLCHVNRAHTTKHQDVMHPLDVPEAFARWHLDFIGELPISNKGNRWIITAVDSLTNWPIARSVPYASAQEVANFLYEEIVMRFGCPAEIITDRGSAFTSNLIKSYVHRMGTNHKLTSAFHPRTNSKVERFNGIIKPILRKYVNGAIHRWDDFLETALWACRIRKHTTTGNSPFKLTYGRDPKIPGDALRPFIDAETAKDPRTIADYTSRELEALGQLRAAAEFRVKAVNERDREKWDAAVKPVGFEPGDMVTLTNEGGYGLEPLHKGPYIVLQHYPDYGTYKLETVEGKPLDSLIHADRLQAAYGEKPSQPWYEPSSFLRRPVVIHNDDDNDELPQHHIPPSARPMNQPIVVGGSNYKNAHSYSTGTYSSGGGGGSSIGTYIPPIKKSAANLSGENVLVDKIIPNDSVSIASEDTSLNTGPIDQDGYESNDDSDFEDCIEYDEEDLIFPETDTTSEILIEAEKNVGDIGNAEVATNTNMVENEDSIKEDDLLLVEDGEMLDHGADAVDTISYDISDLKTFPVEPLIDLNQQIWKDEQNEDQSMKSASNSNQSDKMEEFSDKSDLDEDPPITQQDVETEELVTDTSPLEHLIHGTDDENKEEKNRDVEVDMEDPPLQQAISNSSIISQNELSQNKEPKKIQQVKQPLIETPSSIPLPTEPINFWSVPVSAPTMLIPTSSVNLPPPTPRLRPVVTTPHIDPQSSVSPTSRPPETEFSFTFTSASPTSDIIVSDNPIESLPTHQAKLFTSVPGVTPISEGDNVELSRDDNWEETPEFIINWNRHKTKRFRPTVPNTRNVSLKRQRIVAPIRLPPRNTHTQYKYPDRYDK